MELAHKPVMVEEVMGFLLKEGGSIYVDCTVGSGGHTKELLHRCKQCFVIGIDTDQQALQRAKQRLPGDRVLLIKGRFSQIEALLKEKGFKAVDGVLMDLGVSMEQIKDPKRGFSFISDELLDMRMDQSQQFSALDIVRKYPLKELERIIKEYGQEPKAHLIAREIVRRRSSSPISTCRQLAEIVERIYKSKRTKIHPATRTFQALRIAVNSELEELQKGLSSAIKILNRGGRLVVISYHSLEDRIVKNFMRQAQKEGYLKVLNKKVIRPSEEEVRSNPASRSAKLRAAERC